MCEHVIESYDQLEIILSSPLEGSKRTLEKLDIMEKGVKSNGPLKLKTREALRAMREFVEDLELLIAAAAQQGRDLENFCNKADQQLEYRMDSDQVVAGSTYAENNPWPEGEDEPPPLPPRAAPRQTKKNLEEAPQEVDPDGARGFTEKLNDCPRESLV